MMVQGWKLVQAIPFAAIPSMLIMGALFRLGMDVHAAMAIAWVACTAGGYRLLTKH